jgi:hypothetical protein
MKYGVFTMGDCSARFVICSDIVLRAAVCPSLNVMLNSGVMMLGCGDVMRGSIKLRRQHQCGRLQLVQRASEITRQWAILVPDIASACCLSVFQGAKFMTMGGQRLMSSVCIVLANHVVVQSLAVEMRGLIVMYRCRYVMVRGVECSGHNHPSCAYRIPPKSYAL